MGLYGKAYNTFSGATLVGGLLFSETPCILLGLTTREDLDLVVASS